MSPEPKEPPARPGRIIVPGAEPEAPPAAAPRIVAPDGKDPDVPAAPRPSGADDRRSTVAAGDRMRRGQGGGRFPVPGCRRRADAQRLGRR